MGTQWMGIDPTTSVVHARQRSHDHPNLFLRGSGVYPTFGSASPALTSSAPPLRSADTIKHEPGR